MRVTNEAFTVKFNGLYDSKTKAGSQVCAVIISQGCPKSQNRTIDYKLTFMNGKAKGAHEALPAGTEIVITDGLLTNESYNRAARDEEADWHDQTGILILGELKITKKAVATTVEPGDESGGASVANGATLPF